MPAGIWDRAISRKSQRFAWFPEAADFDRLKAESRSRLEHSALILNTFSILSRGGLAAAIVFLSQQITQAERISVAVENKDWVPYYVWENGRPSGPCPEIAEGALQQMGVEVNFVGVPWARVLLEVEQQSVDAGLCGTKTPERAAFSYFPIEPLLSYDATLFVRSDSALENSDPSTMKGMTFGSIKGYNYGGVDVSLEQMGMTRLNANDREALLSNLINGRLGVVLDSKLPTMADARRLGIEAKIRPLVPSLSETPAYLFFSYRDGHDELAKRFSEALRQFKTTDEYRAILDRYGF